MLIFAAGTCDQQVVGGGVAVGEMEVAGNRIERQALAEHIAEIEA